MADSARFGDLNGPLAYWGPAAPPARPHQTVQPSLALRPHEQALFGDLFGPLFYQGPSLTTANRGPGDSLASQLAA